MRKTPGEILNGNIAMVNINSDTEKRGMLPANENADKVRKVIEDVCKAAGTSVAIDERVGDGEKDQPANRRRLHMTYTGERPLAFANWFKLVDSIDEALDPLGLIDWEYSELSEETDAERMAAWVILAP